MKQWTTRHEADASGARPSRFHSRRHDARRTALAALVAALLLTGSLLAVVGCRRNDTAATATSASAETPTAPAPAARNPLEVIRAKTTMADALLVAAPLMTDTRNESSLGTLLFAAWASERMRWTDIGTEKDETSYAACQKDLDAERMKRMSVTGTVIQINVHKDSSAKWFTGLMQNYGGDLFHFHAVRSTDRVLKGVTAKFYGVVTGWFDYDNSAHGVGHAVDMVGMFGVPENRALVDMTPPPATAEVGAAPSPAAAINPNALPPATPKVRRGVAPPPAVAPPPKGNCGCAAGDLTCGMKCAKQ